ncbi:MAG TPA: DUF4878 domain-containing protein [Pyrinomonadaceae bacterium]|nr:DUF4878 domain-containing protein [Pyrinomonadaceae bacterium]
MKVSQRLSLLAVALCLLCAGCASLTGTGMNSTPGDTLKEFYAALGKGDMAEANRLVAGAADGYKQTAALKNSTPQLAEGIKSRGGLKSVDIQSEDGEEQTAQVTAKVTYNNGTSENVSYELAQEDRDWKVARAK